jgi:hypothetical protein
MQKTAQALQTVRKLFTKIAIGKKQGSKGQDQLQQGLLNPSSTTSNTPSKGGDKNSKGGNTNPKGGRKPRGALHPGRNSHPIQRSTQTTNCYQLASATINCAGPHDMV